MIIRLNGGLGNQMFQYAYGRSLSLKNNSEFNFFFVSYKTQTLRNYALGIFNIKGKQVNSFVPELLVEVSDFFKITIPGIHCGYWQSEKYFKEYEIEIREDFTFKEPPKGRNLECLNKIKSTNSVSLHIRRGDYANVEKVKRVHGLLSISYYKDAIGIIKNNVRKPVFFVFSDDINWCKSNLKFIKNITYVNWNEDIKNYEDLRLMCNCKHNIIANSSFSWWGAWLNTNPNKIVVAPRKWFVDHKTQKEVGNQIIPKTWVKI